jgi:prepilin-type N-terminal cleavage/methylation domain-containing protein
MSGPVAEQEAQAGFTVLELLIGLCILSLFSIYAITAFRQIGHMKQMIDRIEAASSIVAVESHVRSLLSGARPIMVRTSSAASPVVSFSGGKTGLSLVTVSDGELEIGGLYAARLELRRRADGLFDFVTIRRRFQRSLPGANKDQTHMLLEGIADLRFRYFGPESSGAPSSWRPDWISRETLPELVEVTVTFPSESQQLWPRLIIRPVSGP